MIRSGNEIGPQFQAQINSTTRGLTMSKLLEEACTKHEELPEADQDSIATWLLDETVSDGDWKSEGPGTTGRAVRDDGHMAGYAGAPAALA